MSKEMIDLERIREDYELHLGNREFKGIVAAGIVIGLLIFAAGFLVGRLFPGQDLPEHWMEANPPETHQSAVSGADLSAGNSQPDVLKKEGPATAKVPASVLSPSPRGGEMENEAALQKALHALSLKPSAGLSGTEVPRLVGQPMQIIPSLYTLQIGAFEGADLADQLAHQLQEEGYPAYTMTKTVPGKGLWHRVRVGRYASHAEAEEVMNRLMERKHLSGFITLYAKPAEKK